MFGRHARNDVRRPRCPSTRFKEYRLRQTLEIEVISALDRLCHRRRRSQTTPHATALEVADLIGVEKAAVKSALAGLVARRLVAEHEKYPDNFSVTPIGREFVDANSPAERKQELAGLPLVRPDKLPPEAA